MSLASKALDKTDSYLVPTSTLEIHRGYRKFTGYTEDINQFMDNLDFSDWYCNEYLIIKDLSSDKVTEQRFDGKELVPLKLPNSKYIKGKNSEQRCALDMLANKDITVCVLLGTYGSGKSYLCMKMALYAVKDHGQQTRILGVREPLGEGRGLGYLPGDFEQKNAVWTLPLIQQLDRQDYEADELRDDGVLDFNIPAYMKGTSYSSTIMVIDEAEDLTKKQLKMIGTRAGENSRIFFDGDYRQSAVNGHSSPLLMMCEELKGNPLFAHITLNEDVRSETSRMFAHLFEDESED